MDFDPIKKVVTLGYENGIIQFFNIESRVSCNITFNIMLPHL